MNVKIDWIVDPVGGIGSSGLSGSSGYSKTRYRITKIKKIIIKIDE